MGPWTGMNSQVVSRKHTHNVWGTLPKDWLSQIDLRKKITFMLILKSACSHQMMNLWASCEMVDYFGSNYLSLASTAVLWSVTIRRIMVLCYWTSWCTRKIFPKCEDATAQTKIHYILVGLVVGDSRRQQSYHEHKWRLLLLMSSFSFYMYCSCQ